MFSVVEELQKVEEVQIPIKILGFLGRTGKCPLYLPARPLPKGPNFLSSGSQPP